MSDFDDKATVTGAIASFSNGADEVPIASGIFSIIPSQAGTGTPSPSNPRSISGAQGMTITHTDGQTPPVESETLAVSWQTEAGTVYGGELNVTTGVLTVTHAYIASYNGETINEPWISSIDAYVAGNTPTTGAQVVYPLNQADYQTYQLTAHELRTFYGANNFYCDTGDSEITYYKSGYGYTSVTVNRTGKNLSPVSEYPTNPWVFWGTNFLLMRDVLNTLRTGTYTISFTFEVNEVPDTNNITYGMPYIRALVNGSYVNLTSYTLTDALGISVGDKFTSTATFTIDATTAGNVAYCYAYCDKKESHSGTGRGSYNLISVQIEVGSHASAYVPYEAPISKTAKLHKVIYAGEVDVIKGTAKPKNLIDDSKKLFLSKNIVIGRDSGTLYDKTLTLKAGTYTISIETADNAYTNIYCYDVNAQGQVSGFPAYSTRVKTFTIESDTDVSLYVYKSTYESTSDILSAQIESGSPASDYVPHFEPFTFPPISMETVEGTNVLYANEGDSTIIYRKQAEA